MDWGRYKNTHCFGWKDIGYHSVIIKSGKAMGGRSVVEVGAHCKGHNEDSVGICVTGEKNFSEAQFKTLCHVVYATCQELGLDVLKDVFPHSHFDKSGKTCPNFDWPTIWKKYGSVYEW